MNLVLNGVVHLDNTGTRDRPLSFWTTWRGAAHAMTDDLYSDGYRGAREDILNALTDDGLAKVIAENLPSPMAMDMAWRQTPEGAVFDLSEAGPYAEEWRSLAKAVKEAMSK